MASPNHSTGRSSAPDTAAGQRPSDNAGDGNTVIALEAVAQAIARLRYGAIGLTVHDGRVVQLDVTERQRFT